MQRTRGKILVIRGGAIGDFILTLPVLSALRRQFPETHLEVLGYPHIAGLALLNQLVDAVRSIEAQALACFFARSGPLDLQMAHYFSEFSCIVSYLYDPDLIFQKNIAECSKAQFIAGPHRPDESVRLHATEVFLKPLEHLAIYNADPIPRLASAELPASSTPFRLAVHPGSGSHLKNWPEDNWVTLMQHLERETRWDFFVVGGEAEGDRVERLSGLLQANRVGRALSLPLPKLAVELRSCNAFIGHDSGISHLAIAVGLPGLILWGPTNDLIWKPRGIEVDLVIARGGLDHLPIEQVVAALLARWQADH